MKNVITGSFSGNVTITNNKLFVDGRDMTHTLEEVVPTGTIGSKTMKLPPWGKISMSGSSQTEIHMSSKTTALESSVEIFVDSAMLPFLEARVTGETLRFIYTKSLSIRGDMAPPKYVIQTQGPLLQVSLSGSGSMVVTGISQETMGVEMTGSCKVQLEGQLKNLKLSSSGSGSLEASDLEADLVKVSMSGSGCTSLNTRSVKGSMSGSGQLSVPAHTLTEISQSGSGKVRRR